jgi:hypothetical protein
MILLQRAGLLGVLSTGNLGIGFAFQWLPVDRLEPARLGLRMRFDSDLIAPRFAARCRERVSTSDARHRDRLRL